MKSIKQFFVIFIVTITVFYIIINRFIIKDDQILPYKINIVKFLIFLTIIFIYTILALFALLKISLNENSYFSKFKEEFDKNFNFIILFIDKSFKDFDDIYHFLRVENKNFLFNTYLLINLNIRLIVFIVFFIEVFIFFKISYFFKLLPFLLLPFIFKLFLYLIKRYLEIYVEQLTPKVQPIVSEGTLSLELYVKRMAMKLTTKEENVEVFIALDPDYVDAWETQNNKKMNLESTCIKFKSIIEDFIINYSVITDFENAKKHIEVYFNFIIRLGYLITWSFVLYINDPSTFFTIINFIININDIIEEPFSGLLM